jgi:hypothetical protein
MVAGGLEGGEGSGLRLVLLFLLVDLSLFFVFDQLVYKEGYGAFALGGLADFGWRGEGAQFGMGGGLLDEFGLRGLGFGEV